LQPQRSTPYESLDVVPPKIRNLPQRRSNRVPDDRAQSIIGVSPVVELGGAKTE
jgi:hypothetical protein